MTACFFDFGTAAFSCMDVCYTVLALELDALMSVFCRHFDNPNKKPLFNESFFFLAFKIEFELRLKNVLLIRR